MRETCKRCHHDRSEHADDRACYHTTSTQSPRSDGFRGVEIASSRCSCTRFVVGPVEDRLAPRPWRS